MSLTYGVGGATSALGVVGLCELRRRSTDIVKKLTDEPDLLFTGDGEAFNVRITYYTHIRLKLMERYRSDNSWKRSHHMLGQTLGSPYA